jgi:cytochrome c biogenesis protein ResB
MFFSPVDPVWVAFSVFVSFFFFFFFFFFVTSGLCFCLIEAVKAGQRILTKQQESMSEEDRKHICKRKKRGEKEREKEKGEKANSKGKGNSEKEKGKKEGKIKVISDKEKEIVKIYPSLKDLNLSSSASSARSLVKMMKLT